MTPRPRIAALLLLALLSFHGANAIAPGESQEAFEQRMAWWSEGRLGLFLHWGVYSTFGGEYQGHDYGKEMGQASAEWIYLKADIPQDDYRRAALEFNPQDYDPRDWVRQAKAAGMKYIVLTSKHHDGFALFATDASDWNAARASGIRRDLIREFVDACHEADMRVGFYYSHEKDWSHHDRATRSPGAIPAGYEALVETQLRELLTQYGRIDLIWFDTPVQEHEAFNRKCAALVRELQPDCIINGRIGNNLGDYRNIGDRAIVEPGEEGYTESIMTMRLNWGFDRNDDYWKSSEELIRMVSRSACRGSNFLLNIGPTPEGTFPPEDQVRLRDLGAWMRRQGEAIHGTNGSPFRREHPWGSLTWRREGNAVFLHLWNWSGGPIELHGLVSPIRRAAFLDDGAPVDWKQDAVRAVTRLQLPAADSGGTLRIIRLQTEGMPTFDAGRGPDYIPPPVQHVTHVSLTGEITSVDGTAFTIEGRKIVSGPRGEERMDAKISTLTFPLNDHTRYRVNDQGDIRLVQGFALEVGMKCRVVYSPYPEGNELEIITALR